MASSEHFLYVLECYDGTYYTGYTNNLQRRIKMHEEGKGAKYTRGRGPFILKHYEGFSTKQEAMRAEYKLKRLTRKKKEEYIQQRSEDV